MATRLREFLLGKRLASSAIAHERLSNLQALAIFGADALSSTAYATEEVLLVLAGASVTSLYVATPIAVAIVLLILLVAVSYRQVVKEYPQGGGVYNVARENLGELPSLIGGSSLLIDYVLTAAVSTAAGVAALTSAFPELYAHRVATGIAVIVLLTWANLRGVRESGRLFSIPTYLFVSLFFLLIGYGLFRHFNGTYPVVSYATPPPEEAFGMLGVVLILRAFSGGCTALTGIEAISNGVNAFKPDESKNAARVLVQLAVLLGVIFLGVTMLAHWAQVRPIEGETVVSQVARNLLGRSPVYFLIQWATFIVLFLAANTPFAGFPRVASQLALHGYFPRQFANLGSRLVFVNGIVLLGALAALLIVVFGGDVHALIPLYAVGVFIGFSLSQAGMVVHWRKLGGHMSNMMINALGFVATATVFGVILFSKFTHGAWILLPAITLLVLMMKSIRTHYQTVGRLLAPEATPPRKIHEKKTMVILVSGVNRGVIHAVQFARSLNPAHLRALHVALSPEGEAEMREHWMWAFPEIPIDIIHDEFRDINETALNYLQAFQKANKSRSLIVVMVEFVPPRWWQNFLHNQMALRLRYEIEQSPDINAEILTIPIKMTPKDRQVEEE